MSFFIVKDLEKNFGDTEVLRKVSFTLEKGEVLSVIGSSGGGKTTLLRILNFLENADKGEISIGGECVMGLNENSGKTELLKEAQLSMGLVFQQFNLFPQYSVRGNLILAPKANAKKMPNFRKDKNEIYQKIESQADEILVSLGLSDKADCYPYQLSGGQQQRVAIARALMLSPKILCFDEPTSALDPELTGEVTDVIKKLKHKGMTMIIVTHDISFARSVSDKVIFISEGKVEETGTPEEVLVYPQSEKMKSFLSSFGRL